MSTGQQHQQNSQAQPGGANSGASAVSWWSRHKTKLAVALITVLLLFYLILTVERAYVMLIDHSWIAKGIGFAYLVLPILGAYLLCRELLFGAQMQRMARELEAEQLLPEDTLSRTAGGRISREAADRDFEAYKRETEADEGDWRRWYRLALAYDASSDRKRARAAMRRAAGLYRAAHSAGGKHGDQLGGAERD